jgi:hypothetical protein
MHVEEAEDLRLGKSEGVPDGAGLERGVFRQLDDELHAQRPLAPRVPAGKAELLVERLADRADGPSPTTVSCARTSMPGMKPSAGAPCLSTP